MSYMDLVIVGLASLAIGVVAGSLIRPKVGEVGRAVRAQRASSAVCDDSARFAYELFQMGLLAQKVPPVHRKTAPESKPMAPEEPWDVPGIRYEAIMTEIEANLQSGLRAWDQLSLLSKARLPRGEDEPAKDTRKQISLDLWAHASELIMAQGRLSHHLWETSPGNQLRHRISVPSNSPLRPTRVRNALEHIDGQLPGFIKTNEKRRLAGYSITTDPSHRPSGSTVELRSLNLATWDCSVYDPEGETQYVHCSLTEIAKAMKELDAKLLSYSTSHLRVPS